MKRSVLSITAALVAATTLTASPVLAQGRRPHTEGSQRSRDAEGSRGAEGRAVERAVPRAEAAPRNDDRARRNDYRGPQNRYDTRDYRYRNDRPVVVAPRVIRPSEVRPYVARPYYARPYSSRPYYSRPYYVRPYEFRPRLRISLGLFAGYPVPYAYAYPYPVPVYGYSAPSAPVIVGPGSMTYGGVSLEISPGDASVYVDGQYAGVVEEFDGTRQTLTLVNGRHRIDISAPGYEPMSFDVDVYPGQIVPFRGDLQPRY